MKTVMEEYRELQENHRAGKLTDEQFERARRSLIEERKSGRRSKRATGGDRSYGVGTVVAVVLIVSLLFTTNLASWILGLGVVLVVGTLLFAVPLIVIWCVVVGTRPAMEMEQFAYGVHPLQLEQAAQYQQCPDCLSEIPKAAKACAHCGWRRDAAA